MINRIMKLKKILEVTFFKNFIVIQLGGKAMPTTTTACCRPSNLKTFPADRVPRSLCEGEPHNKFIFVYRRPRSFGAARCRLAANRVLAAAFLLIKQFIYVDAPVANFYIRVLLSSIPFQCRNGIRGEARE
jgi:hypothetical protein